MALETELIETPFGSFHCPKQGGIVQHLKRFGAHQRNELAMILSMLRPGDHVIDVGAHVGTICLPMATKIGNAGHAYAFEASAEIYELLEKNVAINLKEDLITPLLAIVTDEPGNFLMDGTFVPRFIRHHDGPGVGAECVHLNEWWEQTSGRLHRGGKIDFIKVDVEGMETEVLRSCQGILATDKPILYVEVIRRHLKRSGSDIAELDALLRSFGYHYFRNIGVRHASDEFQMGRLHRLEQGGPHFDVLAVHPDSDRYPTSFRGVKRTVIKIQYKEFEKIWRFSQPSMTLKRYLRRLGSYIRPHFPRD